MKHNQNKRDLFGKKIEKFNLCIKIIQEKEFNN